MNANPPDPTAQAPAQPARSMVRAAVSFGRMLILAQRRFARGAAASLSPADAAAR